jgi:hypothetical protein
MQPSTDPLRAGKKPPAVTIVLLDAGHLLKILRDLRQQLT